MTAMSGSAQLHSNPGWVPPLIKDRPDFNRFAADGVEDGERKSARQQAEFPEYFPVSAGENYKAVYFREQRPEKIISRSNLS